MAIGNPRLVTWTSNVIRIHELVGAGFVQIATIGAEHDATLQGEDIHPELFFANDNAHVIARHSPTTSEPRIRSFSLALSQISNLQLPSSGVGGRLRQAYTDAHKLGISTSAESNAIGGGNCVRISAAGVLTQGTNRLGFAPGTSPFCLVLSPDGNYVFRGDVAQQSIIWPASGTLADGAPDYPLGQRWTLTAIDEPIHRARWSPDSRILYALSREGRVYVLRFTNGQFVVVSEISEIGETPVQVALAPDNRTVAVSYDNGPRIATRIYNRVGDSFAPVQTIASESFSFGGLLDFSGDGQYLIDAQNRRAYRKVEGVWTDTSSIMSTLPAGIVSQAVSTHVPTISGSVQLYDKAVAALVTGTVNLSDLKLMLLDGSAGFDPEHESVLEVNSNGEAEVSGFGWPLGGRQLENAQTVQPTAFSMGFTFDDVEQIVIEGNLVFRYAVVYDSVSLEPLLWIDFQEEVTGARNRELVFEMPSAGLFTFSS